MDRLWASCPPLWAPGPWRAAPFETGTVVACRRGWPDGFPAVRRWHASQVTKSMGSDTCVVPSLLCSATALLGCIGLAWVAVQIRSWLLRSQKLLGIPMPKPHWLFGHLQVLKQPDHHLVMRQWAEELGGMFRMRLGPIQVLHALGSTVHRISGHTSRGLRQKIAGSLVLCMPSIYPVWQVHTRQ